MIGIRSITYHAPQTLRAEYFETVSHLADEWNKAYPLLRTQRIALTPQVRPMNDEEVKEISSFCEKTKVRWFNIPTDPWHSNEQHELFAFAKKTIESYNNAFINVQTFVNGQVDQEITDRSAELINKVAQITSNGESNFRLGLSVNIQPNGAFFPFSYSSGESGFSIALELLQEMNVICENNPDVNLVELREKLVCTIQPQIDYINELAKNISNRYGIIFKGFDFSIAPILEEHGAIMPLLKRMGIEEFGATGMMFATAFLTDICKSFEKKYEHVGFSGVMYSLLEDQSLCDINNTKGIALDDLIKLSTMCGCGADMIPIPGDTDVSTLRNIIYDVYAISTRLKKPLGIRLLPIPDCKNGQKGKTNLTEDADFISNTFVLEHGTNCINKLGDKFSFLYY